MKALLLPVLLAVLALPSASQEVKDGDKDKTDSIGGDTSELKKKFKNQRPPAGAAADDAADAAGKAAKAAKRAAEEAVKNAEGAVDAVGGAAAQDSTDELESLLLQNGWKKDAADNDKMSAELKKKHRILHRVDPAAGKEYAVLVPKEVAEGRQLVYRSVLRHAEGVPPLVLKRVRAAGHLLVLEFDQQQQYLNLNKPDPANGFVVEGFTHLEGPDKSPAARKFADADAFLDALEHQLKTDAAKASVGLKERIKTVSGGKPFQIEAYVMKKGLVILLLTGGQAHQLYPDPAAPTAAPAPGAPKEAKPR